MRYIVPLLLLLGLGACNPSSEVGKGAVNAQPPREPAKEPVPPKLVHRLAPGQLAEGERADYLKGPSVWTFDYCGGRVRCWLEIDDNGQKTKLPPDGLRDPNKEDEKASQGKIVAWWRPGELGVRVISGVVDSPGRMSLPEDGLWWGFGGSTENLWVESNAVTPKEGAEVTLVRAEYVESEAQAKDPNARRKVVVLFKASFPED